jgi:inosine/xanthosine triphosphate pyrophosphatase family protein
MQELVVGTSNPAKLQMIRDALAPLAIRVIGTHDLGISLQVEEDGLTAQDNARKKSLAYAQATGQRVLSIDNALYLDGLADHEQPGIATRRIPGYAGRASDQQLLVYYAQWIARLGGRIDGRWEFAICLAGADGRYFETVIRSPRTFISMPSTMMIPGYPLESIQIDPASGSYLSEMPPEEQAAFWQQTIGRELCDFLRQVQEQLNT